MSQSDSTPFGDRLKPALERLFAAVGSLWLRYEKGLADRYETLRGAQLTGEERRVLAVVGISLAAVVALLALNPVDAVVPLPVPSLTVPFVVSTLAIAGMYLLLTLGLNVQWGYAGLVNFSVIAFWGIGAYSGALLAGSGSPHELELHPLYGLGLAVVLSVVLAVAIGLPTLRLRADYLAIATLGFSEIIRIIILNEEWLTDGGLGVGGIPTLLSTWPFSLTEPVMAALANLTGAQPRTVFDLFLVMAVVLAVFLVLRRTQLSPWGRVLRTIRADEDIAQALGKNSYWYKMQAFVLGSVIMAIAGWYYAHHVRFMTPGELEPIETFYIWVAVILGGSGSNRGAIIGGFTVVIILQGTRLLNETVDWILFFVTVDASALRLLLVGLLVIVVVRLRPEGILPPQREHIWPGALSERDGGEDK